MHKVCELEKKVVQITDVTCEMVQEDEINLEAIVGHKPCRFLIDTGANISIIKKKGLRNNMI